MNANLVLGPGEWLPNGTLLIRDGIIEAAGTKINIPKGAVVHDLKGKWVYPSFIDLYSDYGMPEAKKESKKRQDGP